MSLVIKEWLRYKPDAPAIEKLVPFCGNLREIPEEFGVFSPVCESYKEYTMSRIIRKPSFYICENKDADQQHGNCAVDQSFCYRCRYFNPFTS